MIEQYVTIATALLAVPEIRWIDIDQGQLEEPESGDAVLPTAVLVSFLDADPLQFLEGVEEFETTLVVKCVFALQNDTHVTNMNDIPRFTAKLAVLDIAKKVHKKLIELDGSVKRKLYKGYYKKEFGSWYIIEMHYDYNYRELEESEQVILTIGEDFDLKMKINDEPAQIVSPVS